LSPRELRDFVVLGFASTHDALSAEAIMKDMGVDAVTVPAPKEIGTLCGIALRVSPEHAERARELLVRGGIEPTASVVVQDV